MGLADKNRVLQFMAFLLLALGLGSSALAVPAVVVPLWGNEPLRQDQGVLSLEARGEGFSAPGGEMANQADPLQILVRHLSSGTFYVIYQPLTLTTQKQRSLYWKLPAGKYEIVQIARKSGGAMHSTRNPRSKHFMIEGFALTDLGVWLPRPAANRVLAVNFYARVVQSFWFPKGDDSIDAIIDGFSGKRLQAIGGRGHKRRVAMALAAKTPPPVMARRAPIFNVGYRMDITHYGQYGASLLPTVRRYDNRFRECYLYGSQGSSGLQGTAQFTFALAKGRGTFKTLSYRGGTLANRQAIECLHTALAQVQFPVQAPITGNLTLDFQAR